jgi:Leu/Phe-tRNA-protein transferase
MMIIQEADKNALALIDGQIETTFLCSFGMHFV